MMRQEMTISSDESGKQTAYLVTFGFDLSFARKTGQQPHFSITVEYWRHWTLKGEKELPDGPTTIEEYGAKRVKACRRSSGGAAHDIIREKFPHLADATRWHMADNSATPMHYVANTLYHRDHLPTEFVMMGDWTASCPPRHTDRYGASTSELIRRVRSCMAYGALDGETAPEGEGPESMSRYALESHLIARTPRLLQAMTDTLEAVGVTVPDESITNQKTWAVSPKG